MQRTHLTLGLLGAAILAAVVVPQLPRRAPAPADDPAPTPPPPQQAGPLRLSAGLDQPTLLRHSGGARYLVLEVIADAGAATRRDAHLALVLDTSGSMAEEGKIDAVRAAADQLVDQLAPNDTLSIITFDDQAWVRVPTTAARDRGLFHNAIASLAPGGATNLYDGVRRGLEELRHAPADGARRLVLLSDGLANVGEVDNADLAALGAGARSQDATLSAVGVGVGFDEDLLAAMSERGGGTWRYADRPDRLAELFREELAYTTALVAQDVALSLDLGPDLRITRALGVSLMPTPEGASVYLGTMRAGERRHLVLEVACADDALGPLDLGEARLRYVVPDRSAKGEAVVAIEGVVVSDAAAARSSADLERGRSAASALAGEALDRSTRAWEDGQTDDAASDLEAARQEIRALAARLGSDDLGEAIPELEERRSVLYQVDAQSAPGKVEIKRNKERARALTTHPEW